MKDGPGVQRLKRALRALSTPLPLNGIPANLYNRLELQLLRCMPQDIAPLFIDSRLFQWRDHLPTANNPLEQGRVLIDFLFLHTDRHNDNALILFLDVLRDRTNPRDACYKALYQLRCELMHIIK